MLIERHEFLDPEGAKPIISGVTAFGNLVVLKDVVPRHLSSLPIDHYRC